jgi:hypothetical protein
MASAHHRTTSCLGNRWIIRQRFHDRGIRVDELFDRPGSRVQPLQRTLMRIRCRSCQRLPLHGLRQLLHLEHIVRVEGCRIIQRSVSRAARLCADTSCSMAGRTRAGNDRESVLSRRGREKSRRTACLNFCDGIVPVSSPHRTDLDWIECRFDDAEPARGAGFRPPRARPLVLHHSYGEVLCRRLHRRCTRRRSWHGRRTVPASEQPRSIARRRL